jgi:hypothetical protein
MAGTEIKGICKLLSIERSDIFDLAASIGCASKHVKRRACWRITLDALTPPMHAVSDFRAPGQAAAQRGAVHGAGLAGGELDVVAVVDEINRLQQYAWSWA